MRVSILILTLDELEGISSILPRIKKEWYHDLVIVDGGSTDGTFEYVKEQGYFIFRQVKKGFGAAITEGAEKLTGDMIIVLSPDGNSIPELIPKITDKMNQGYDIVVASRYREGAKSYDDDMVTALGNRMFTALVNLFFRANITDSLVMYRAYKKSVIEEFSKTGVNTWGLQPLARAAKRKMKIGEIPGDEPARIGGVRKMMPIRNGLSELGAIVRELFIY